MDVISAFSGDGRIAADNLKVLADPKHAIPSYDAVIVISTRRRNDETLRAALSPLIGAIPVERMREANYMLDRDTDKATVREPARFLATGAGLAGRLQPDVRRWIEIVPKTTGIEFFGCGAAVARNPP